jgi:hypothetical protein
VVSPATNRSLRSLQSVYGELPAVVHDAALRESLLSWWPDVIGGVLFVLGSWLFWWSAHETPWLHGPTQNNLLVWCLTATNMLGSLGFFAGAAFATPILTIPGLVSNWMELLIGYVVGSALFLVGSYLMIVELGS